VERSPANGGTDLGNVIFSHLPFTKGGEEIADFRGSCLQAEVPVFAEAASCRQALRHVGVGDAPS